MEDNKKKYAYWMKPSMVAEIEASLELANVKSKGEFVCQAVDFYLGYLNHKKTVNYLSPLLLSAIKSELRSSTKFIREILFNVAVETAINSRLTALNSNFGIKDVPDLRKLCEIEVAESNGVLKAERADEYAEQEYGNW